MSTCSNKLFAKPLLSVAEYLDEFVTFISNNNRDLISNDEDDGSENVPKKLNLCSFKLNRVYLDPLNIYVKCRRLFLELNS